LEKVDYPEDRGVKRTPHLVPYPARSWIGSHWLETEPDHRSVTSISQWRSAPVSRSSQKGIWEGMPACLPPRTGGPPPRNCLASPVSQPISTRALGSFSWAHVENKGANGFVWRVFCFSTDPSTARTALPAALFARGALGHWRGCCKFEKLSCPRTAWLIPNSSVAGGANPNLSAPWVAGVPTPAGAIPGGVTDVPQRRSNSTR
jgi:hypothetical protein